MPCAEVGWYNCCQLRRLVADSAHGSGGQVRQALIDHPADCDKL
jgi:hypothetical protein